MFSVSYKEKELLSYLSEKDRETVKNAIEQFKNVKKATHTLSIGGQLYPQIELKFRSNDRYEVHKGTISTIWYRIPNGHSGTVMCEFSQYIVYSFKLSEKSGNWGTYKKTYHNTKPISQDITLTEYLEDEDIKWLVDSTLDMFFDKSSVALFNKITSEGIKLRYSINTILNPANKTKTDVITQRGKYKLPKSIEKYPFVYGLFLREASKVFSEDAMSIFYSFGKANIFCKQELRDKGLAGLLELGCKCLLWPRIDPMVVYSYLRHCRESKEKARIDIKSEETMVKQVAMLEIKDEETKQMDVDKVYVKLEKLLNGKYHLLRKNSEMLAESLKQKNCVRTYIYAVNNHRCGIFNFDNDGKHYTIEVRYSKERGYECIQFYGFANSYDEECKKLNEIFSKALKTINEELENKRLKRKVA